MERGGFEPPNLKWPHARSNQRMEIYSPLLWPLAYLSVMVGYRGFEPLFHHSLFWETQPRYTGSRLLSGFSTVFTSYFKNNGYPSPCGSAHIVWPFITLRLPQRFNPSCKLLHFRRPHTLPVLNTASKQPLFGAGFRGTTICQIWPLSRTHISFVSNH